MRQRSQSETSTNDQHKATPVWREEAIAGSQTSTNDQH